MTHILGIDEYVTEKLKIKPITKKKCCATQLRTKIK